MSDVHMEEELKNKLEECITYLENRREGFFDGYIEKIWRENEKICIEVEDVFYIEEIFEYVNIDWETHHKKGEIYVCFNENDETKLVEFIEKNKR